MTPTTRKKPSATVERGAEFSPGPGLEQSLQRIANEAMNLTNSDGVSVVNRDSDGHLRATVEVGRTDGRGSILTVPLATDSRDLGALTLYRAREKEWSRDEVVICSILTREACTALAGARLFEEQQLQIGAVERMARMLAEQDNDYANRLHALAGLLALGETRAARRLLAELMVVHHETSAAVAERVQDITLAGLLIAQMNNARQRGVAVHLHGASSVGTLPPTVARSELMLITANLVENGIEAVAGMEKLRRRVTVRLTQGDGLLTLSVRDWGEGIDRATADAIAAGARGHPSTEFDRACIAAAQAVHSAGGEIVVQSKSPGTSFRVRLPVAA